MLSVKRFGVFLLTFSLYSLSPIYSKAQSPNLNKLFGVATDFLKLEQSRRSQTGNPPAAAHTPATNPLDSFPGGQLDREGIRQVQAALNALGYDSGTVDGVAGRRTRSALMAWQRASGRPADGVLNRATLSALISATPGTTKPPVAPEGQGVLASGPGPSFDCARASTEGERAICASPALAERDRTLADAYQAATAAATRQTRQKIIAEQRAWLLARQSCGSNDACLFVVMDGRIAVLTANAPIPGDGSAKISPSILLNGNRGSATGSSDQVVSAEPIPAQAPQNVPPGIRTFAPIMSGNRLLTGYPILWGEFSKETIRIDGLAFSKSSFDLASFIDLVILQQLPEILNDQYIALEFAKRFLSGALKERYITECNVRNCNRQPDYMGWQGSNEFEREDTFHAFVAEVGPQLAAVGAKSPVPALQVIKVEILGYDSGKQAFPLRPIGSVQGLTGLGSSILKPAVQSDAKLPKELPMPRDQAKSFVDKFEGKRIAFLAFKQTLSAKEGKFGPRPYLILSQSAVALYADPRAQNLLYDFADAKMAESSATVSEGAFPRTLQIESRSGMLWVGDRVVMPSRFPKFDAPFDAYDTLQFTHAKSVLEVIGAELDFSGLDAKSAGAFFNLFDPEDQNEIMSTAQQRPLTARDTLSLASGVYALQNQFVKRRAAVVIGKKLSAKYAQKANSNTVPFRVYCNASVRAYDFASSSFPITTDCDRWSISAPMFLNVAFDGMNVRLSAEGVSESVDDYPSAMYMDPERAEQFMTGPWQNILLSFETDMTVSTRTTGSGMVVSLSYSAPANFLVHEGRSGINVAFPLDSSGPEPVETTDANNNWDLSNHDHVAQLIQLAGDAKSLPTDARSFGWTDGEPIGSIDIWLWTLNFASEPLGTGNRTTGLFRSFASVQPLAPGSLAMALGLPGEHLAFLEFFGPNDPISAVYAILPDAIWNYSITAPADKYGRRQLAARVNLAVMAVTKVAMPGEIAPILVLSAEPIEASFVEASYAKRNDASAVTVLERFDIRRDVAPPSYELIDFPPRYSLVRAIGTAFGLETKGVMEYNMRHPKGLSAFDIQRRVEAVYTASEAAASDGAVDYWLTGTIQLNDYDFATKTFKFSAGIGLPEMMRDPDLTKDAITTAFIDQHYLKIAVAPEEAEAFAKRLNLPAVLPFRVLVRPRQAQADTYGSLRVSVVAVYGEILDRNADLTIDDPDRVVFRFGERPDLTPLGGDQPKPRMTREEAVAFLNEAIDKDERYILVTRSGAGQVSKILTRDIRLDDYARTVGEQVLDMPKPKARENFIYDFPVKMAEVFRNDPTAAFIISPRRVMNETGPSGTAPDPMREVLISLAQEYDLEIGPFPPKPQAIINTGRTNIDDLLAGDPKHIVLRRRDDSGPITNVYLAKGKNEAQTRAEFTRFTALSRIDMRSAEEAGYSLAFELLTDLNGERYAALSEIPAILRDESNSAIILSPESLKKIFNRISDMDLVGRRFPLEIVSVGDPGRQKQTAKDFSVLGVSGGMSRAAAISALAAEFDINQLGDTQADVVFAGGTSCKDAVGPRAGSPEESALRCVRVEFDGNWVKSVLLRQVIAGDLEEIVQEALLKRFGRSHLTEETRYLEAGATRTTQGWGELVAGGREALGRVDAGIPPTVIEAVIWVQNGMTSVYIRLDNVETVTEQQAVQTPKIKF